ncbi:hypothetical protein [Pseudomonas lundensis]|uniref:Uncharacterized protein n=1 Tax=Pseudomonas lundensis TaxID=86185 RepID=A0AAX2H892_9PSED|nr:hypothetical protein [Pseudomonas lundensis]SOB52505.1 conserved hypothetical protein [Pseudomonas lundensis]
MKITAPLLLANPCDEEEENLATVCCFNAQGDMFLMSRYPDEDELEISLGDNDPSSLAGVKVTLSQTRLLLEVAASDVDVLNGDDHLEIQFDAEATDMQELEQTLTLILDGVGTYASELS